MRSSRFVLSLLATVSLSAPAFAAPTAPLTARVARAEFRSAVKGSVVLKRAQRQALGKSIASSTAALGAAAGAEAGLAIVATPAAFFFSPFIGGTAIAHIGDTLKRARTETTRIGVENKLISKSQARRWSDAGIIGSIAPERPTAVIGLPNPND